MLSKLKSQLTNYLQGSLKEIYPVRTDLPSIDIEIPTDRKFGEFSCNIALKSAKIFRKSPLDVANTFLPRIEQAIESSLLKGQIQKVEVKAPGFINFYLTDGILRGIINQILQEKDQFGRSDLGQGKKVQIEFVSANPTGPLSVAHARQAAVGDALARILKALGFDCHKEYYVNDGGNQINILGRSIRCRAVEILGGTVEFPQDGYQGEYIKDIAQIFMDEQGIKSPDALEAVDDTVIRQFGVNYLLNVIKTDLDDFGVSFDVWAYESKIAAPRIVQTVLEELREQGYLYEQDGALWFRSTDFGDDKDRVVRKTDGSFTYLSPDIVYHKNKFERGFQEVINILGPDHHGYILRIKAAVQALGKDSDALKVLIVQLATIYRKGQVVPMSTRHGKYISLREVIDEVGTDAARFFFLMRHINVHLDFDLELAKKQSNENPVYYIQYAHARVFSINAKAKEDGIRCEDSDFSRIKAPEEFGLILKLGAFHNTLRYCYQQLDPYPMVSYLQELAGVFHKFYDACRVVSEEDPVLSSQRLGLCNAARIVLANGLTLLGLSAPRKLNRVNHE